MAGLLYYIDQFIYMGGLLYYWPVFLDGEDCYTIDQFI